MSTASKVTFAASCLFAIGSFYYIKYEQDVDRYNQRQGPIKDAKRLAQRNLSKKQTANELEHQEQMALKKQYESVQPLNSEIIRGEDPEK
ncbi:hypothetical protein ACI3LY_002697 [Candidozyma auris]|uniref:Uncharacterized protein n=2 Tax=Candidozyma auris TaxID=498019 RepID=A0A2H0ZMC6_CANAR|nr:hypothetical_protein [[Candida] auris]KNE00962.1 hypothetical protein QG37_01833 [[Candida] auris]PIS51790.1 hypothetical protein B9J08_003389 [[Candida] auris]PIS53778.1 hypothetical protein CJI97_003464 [[Candida] auris]PSK78999.1 hypothetical protein CJJ07_001082 [[Candida] auris]QEL58668.1 hypothetical protein CJJ09_000716 [[Candida] auris]